jgi:hypothetical protein
MSNPERREVGVIAEWQAVENAWSDHRWRVTGLLPGAAAAPPWTLLSETPALRRYFAGNAELLLFPLETDTLKHNIDGPQPAVYVFLRMTQAAPGMALLGATVCAGEAQAHADTGADLVEAVPMPPDITAWVAEFVARHHVDRPAYRRRRDRSERETGPRGAAAQGNADDDE